jgi:cytochrome c peroxidase
MDIIDDLGRRGGRTVQSRPMSTTKRFSSMALLIGVMAAGVTLTTNSFGDEKSSGSEDAKPLSSVNVPLPANLSTFVKNKQAAIVLGKALFWDTQTGGTGDVACATCHYNAGVDNRSNNNTVHPGQNGIVNIALPLSAGDFPFNTLTKDDIVGSQGVPAHNFIGLNFGSAVDNCDGTGGTLQTTGRNAPNPIMAIFNRDNFWDGRASREFNGVDPFGKFSDPTKSAPSTAKIWVLGPAGLFQQAVIISPASAASQAVGPPNSAVEMSCKGRNWGHLGRKMINNGLYPLADQYVAKTDSVLGYYSKYPAKGITGTYRDMIRAAFHDQFTSDYLLPNGSGFTQIEQNFSLFWGLSILLYESTLIPNDSLFDKWASGKATLTSQQLLGQQVFRGQGRCDECHDGAEFTDAAINGSGGGAFNNIAVRPDVEDGGQQPGNKSKFKTTTLRNVELTGPYFHNGGYLTLRQVVDFYDRGGNFPGMNTDSQIRPLGLTNTEKNALVAFLLTLTDERVRCEKAPFDHPSITIPLGPSVTAVGSGGRTAQVGGQCLTTYLNANPFTP